MTDDRHDDPLGICALAFEAQARRLRNFGARAQDEGSAMASEAQMPLESAQRLQDAHDADLASYVAFTGDARHGVSLSHTGPIGRPMPETFRQYPG